MYTISFSKTLRVITLLVILGNVLFNYIYELLPLGLYDMRHVSDAYKSMFTPAGYAFSIWGLIYISFIVYGIWQLLPAQLLIKGYDKISLPLLFSNLFGALWIYAFTSQQIGLSVYFMLVILALAIYMFLISHKEFEYSFWKKFPFSLYMGWISVATLANLSAWLISKGWRETYFKEDVWTIIAITVVFTLGLYLSIKFKDLVYPAVLVWAILAIWAANRMYQPNVASVAMISAVSLILLCVLLRILAITQQQRVEESHQ